MMCQHFSSPRRLLLLTIISSILTTLSDAFNTLITFDVDGTLVRGGGASGKSAETGAHARAFSIAVGTILGNGKPTAPITKALKEKEYHGSTDGLILLRLARSTLGIEPNDISSQKLNEMMQVMYEYIATLDDEEVANGINPLPGVIDNLERLSTMKDNGVSCGLVTGNVEGIARRKMRAVGILETGALSPPSQEQLGGKWNDVDNIGFLGGFGSDYCSGNIDDATRNYLDRSEQISIATKRCHQNIITDNNVGNDNNEQVINRVVHVGDAPADVLAAKSFAAEKQNSEEEEEDVCCVGMVGVATGTYSAEELYQLAGEPIPGKWEPIILENGMADPNFINACFGNII